MTDRRVGVADIRGLFDNIEHELLLKALRHHVKDKWVLLYVERWLTAPMQKQRTHPRIPFCRYTDDGILHCRSESQAIYLRKQLATRLKDCGLEMHPQKTQIVYCKDANRTEQHDTFQFDFLGFTFKPRRSINRNGVVFSSFTPSASRESLTAMRQEVRRWRLHLKSETSLHGLANICSATIRGRMQYYGYFRRSEFQVIAKHIDLVLVRWAMRKYKRLHKRRKRAVLWLEQQFLKYQHLFSHWQLSIWFTAGTMGAQ